RFRGALFRAGPTVDRARDAAAGDAVAGVLFGSLGAATDGAAGGRVAVPVVRRARHRRCGMGSLYLLEEPRPVAGRRDRGPVPDRSVDSAADCTTAGERAFLGGRHANRSLGLDEELQAEGAAGRW